MDTPELANGSLRKRTIAQLQKRGVIFIDPRNTYLESSVTIGSGTKVYPNVVLEGETSIGENCTIHSGVEMHDASVADGCTVGQGVRIASSSIGGGVVVAGASHIFSSSIGEGSCVEQASVVKNSMIGPRCIIGPFAYIDHATILAECVVGTQAHVDGSFVSPHCVIEHAQIRRSKLGESTHAEHFSYIGDATTGKRCNISAGVVFCNYDGSKKSETTLEDDVFVGSGSMLVAPLRVGECAFIAAGSVITRDVSGHTLAIARGQRHVHPPSQGMIEHSEQDYTYKEGQVTRDETGWHNKKPSDQ